MMIGYIGLHHIAAVGAFGSGVAREGKATLQRPLLVERGRASATSNS